MGSSCTHAEEHPTADEHHLRDGVWLIGEAAVFPFEYFKFDRDILLGVLESSHEVEVGKHWIFGDVLLVDGPSLRQVSQICKLHVKGGQFVDFGYLVGKSALLDSQGCIVPNLISQSHGFQLGGRQDCRVCSPRGRPGVQFCSRPEGVLCTTKSTRQSRGSCQSADRSLHPQLQTVRRKLGSRILFAEGNNPCLVQSLKGLGWTEIMKTTQRALEPQRAN